MEQRESFPVAPVKLNPRRKWGIYESSFMNYLDTFTQIDTDGKVVSMLEHLRDNHVQDPVIIDLMASKSALKDIQQHYNISPKGLLAVSDKPSLWSPISSIRGDLNEDKTWNKIDKWLGKRKAKIIMERGYQGLDYVPTTLDYQRKTLSRMWDMLDSDGGLLVLQTPAKEVLTQRGIPIKDWLTQLTDHNVYARFEDMTGSEDNPDHRYGVLLLEKNPQVDKLPDISNFNLQQL